MKRIDLTGQRFGRLLVIQYVGGKRYSVRCNCGAKRDVLSKHLVTGHTKSCGCLQRETAAKFHLRHGHSHRHQESAEYRIWRSMLQRCTNPKSRAWAYYGGRGIIVCAEWRRDFAAFLAHVGRRPEKRLTLDRIDNDRGYEPGNVRWATRKTQALNRRKRGTAMAHGPDGRFAGTIGRGPQGLFPIEARS